MKSEVAARLGAVLLAGALLGGSVSGERKDGADKETAGPLIRKDLLSAKENFSAPPLRDIFNPKPAFDAAGSASNGEGPENGEFFDEGDEAFLDGTPEYADADLSYIGYIRSSRKIIALVIVDGEARAVSEGEEILPGVRVKKVTPSRIIVLSPDSTERGFPLQGEET